MTQREDTEKYLEKKLIEKVAKMGGHALKFASALETGYPDRIVLMPRGKISFVELKTKGKKPTKLQTIRHQELRSLGFQVEVIDRTENLNTYIQNLQEDGLNT